MKLKVYVVDMEIPRAVKRRILQLGTGLVLILGAVAFAIAAVPKTWNDGDILTAADLNSNFDNLDKRAVPTGLIGMFASACPTGWSACNGSGSCPDLNGAYVKAGPSLVTPSGSNMHAHMVPAATSGAGGGHGHGLGTLTTTGGDHSHVTRLFFGTGTIYVPAEISAGSFKAPTRISCSGREDATDGGWNGTTGIPTNSTAHSHGMTGALTTAADHTHAVPAFMVPAGNHEPFHATLVFCMKN